MRLITLNCWGGRRIDALLDFFARRGPEVDVFCLQEVFDGDQAKIDARHPTMHGLRGDLFFSIMMTLRDHQGYFARWEDRDRMSTAIFVRRSMPVLDARERLVYEPERPVHEGDKVYSPRKLQTVTLADGDRKFLVANLHGLWINGPKDDTVDRIRQSRLVSEALNAHAGPKVLCGDFNLLPHTASVRMLEVEAQLRNLVLDYEVTSTRTPLYRSYDDPNEPNFADYVMPSRDLEVKRFEVLPDVVSDHAPLYAEFA